MHLAENINLEGGIVGGLLIGVTTTSYLYFTGRITGLSGIVEETCILAPSQENKWWTWFYASGLISSGVIIRSYFPSMLGSSENVHLTDSMLIFAGLAIGFGTRLGSGCTSGHGIAGLPRLSPRSLAAVLTFMTTGSIAATVARAPTLRALITTETSGNTSNNFHYFGPSAATAGICMLISVMKNGGMRPRPRLNTITVADALFSFLSALTFGFGLGIGGMLQTERVHRFLDFSGAAGWDYSLMGVMGGGVLFNMVSFYVMKSSDLQPYLSQKSAELKKSIKYGLDPANLKIDASLLVGAALFGVGWGLSGVCPGPAVAGLGGRVASARILVPSILLGMTLQDLMMKPNAVTSTKTA